MSSGLTKPIEKVEVGELVLSRNEETLQTLAKPVARLWIHSVQATLLLRLVNGEQIETTKEHRFSVRDLPRKYASSCFNGGGKSVLNINLKAEALQSTNQSALELVGVVTVEVVCS